MMIKILLTNKPCKSKVYLFYTQDALNAFRRLALKYMVKCKNYMHFKGASNNDNNSRLGAKIW